MPYYWFENKERMEKMESERIEGIHPEESVLIEVDTMEKPYIVIEFCKRGNQYSEMEFSMDNAEIIGNRLIEFSKKYRGEK